MKLRATFVTFGAVCAFSGFVLSATVLLLKTDFTSVQRVLLLTAALLVITVATAAVGYRLSQMFRRRLYEIEEAAVLMAGGRLQHRVARFGERDEIDQVAQEFNRMGEQLEHQVALLQHLAEENRALAQEAERVATLEERQRLARELHDSVSQDLFALMMLAETAIRRLETGSPKLSDTLAQMAELANRGQKEMRALLLHLRPVELDGRSFQEAATGFLRAVEERHEISCILDFRVQGDLPLPVEEQLFRILQEAMSNVLKHAKATKVGVQVVERAASYELEVFDDGVGLSATSLTASDTYGMKAMRERAARLGGRLEIWPRDPGTTVKVVIPRAETEEQDDGSSAHR